MTPEQLMKFGEYYKDRACHIFNNGASITDYHFMWKKGAGFEKRARLLRYERNQIIQAAKERARQRLEKLRASRFIRVTSRYTDIHPYEDDPWERATRRHDDNTRTFGQYEIREVYYANITEPEARALYTSQNMRDPVVLKFIKWQKVPLRYVSDGMPNAIYQSEGQAKVA